MKNQRAKGLTGWKARAAFGATSGVVTAIIGAFVFDFADEVDRLLYLVFVAIAIGITAFTYSPEKWEKGR